MRTNGYVARYRKNGNKGSREVLKLIHAVRNEKILTA